MSAYEFGKTAYLSGKRCVPASDAAFMATLGGEVSSANIKALKEWQRGWCETNVADMLAPMDDEAA